MLWARYALINSADNSWNSGPFVDSPMPAEDGSTWVFDGVPPDYDTNFDGWDPVHSGFKSKLDPLSELITVGRFKLLFTQDERIALRGAASSNAQVEDFLDLLNGFTDGVSLADPVLSSALGDMVTAGLLTADRVSAILAGQAPV